VAGYLLIDQTIERGIEKLGVEKIRDQAANAAADAEIHAKAADQVVGDLQALKGPYREELNSLSMVKSQAAAAAQGVSALNGQVSALNGRIDEVRRLANVRFCVFAASCPSGFNDHGMVGFLQRDDNSCPTGFSKGAGHPGGWHWCHPRLCCRE
jgi:hypothetical protein